MEQNLKTILLNTLSADANIRNDAELKLKEVGKNPEMMHVIQSVLMRDPSIRVKQVASIFFANAVRQNWKVPEMAHFMAGLREQIITLLVPEDRFPRQCYLNTLQCIFDNSESGETESIVRKLPYFFNSTDRAAQKAALVLITSLLKSEALRYNLENVLTIVFSENGPVFTQRFSEALARKDWEVAKICMKIVARTYMHYSLPDYLNTLAVLEGFYAISLSVMRLENVDDGSMEKLRKWAAYFLFKTANKSFKKYFKNTQFIDFIRKETTINSLLDAFCSIVERYAQGQKFHPTALVHTCDFFALLAQTKTTKPIIKNCFSILLNNFILPSQSFDLELKELFECDAEQYLMLRYNYVSADLRSSTASFFSDIIHIDKGVKAEVIGNLVAFLDKRDAPNYDAYRYGVVGLLATEQRGVARLLGPDNFNRFLASHIIADLNSPHVFLVSQALYFLSMADENSLDPNTSLVALRKVLDLMNVDSEIIPVEAALAMNFFMGNPGLDEAVKGLIPMLFEKVIAFSKQHLLESLSTLMDAIIENYTEVVASFAPQFAESLCSNILEHIERNEEARVSTVSGLISTLDKLIVNADGQAAIVERVYQSAYKVMYTIFYRKIEDFYQETFDLMNSFLYILKRIDADSLRIFTLALSIERDDLSYYPREVNDFVDNFLSYGRGSIINNETLERIYGCIDLFVPSVEPEDDIYDEDFEAGCQISDSLMLNAGSTVHALNPRIIPCIVHKIVVNYEKACENAYLDVLGLETIMNCFMIAPQLVLDSLGSFLPTFFAEVAAKHSKFVRVHDKKVFILFVGALFTITPVCNVDFEGLTEAFVAVLCSLPDAIKKRNRMKEKEEESDHSDEEEETAVSNDECDYEDEDYNTLAEDIWFETELDKLDAYEYVRALLAAPVPKSIGEAAISKMTQPQILRIRGVLSIQQELQKQ